MGKVVCILKFILNTEFDLHPGSILRQWMPNGDSFNENSYAFSGNYYNAKKAVSGTVTNTGSFCSGQVLVFNPNTVSGCGGNGTSSHAVIITNNQIFEYYEVYDPKNNTTSKIQRSELSSGAFIVNVR